MFISKLDINSKITYMSYNFKQQWNVKISSL